MPFAENIGTEKQPYKFGGKEFDTMHGLNQYDFHARQYDPATIRFTTVDPLAEKYYSWSPYVYCGNNPINAIDLRGDSVTITYNTGFLGLGGKQTLTYENGNLYNRDGTTYTGKVKGFLSKAVGALNDLRNTAEGNSIVTELQSSTNVLTYKKDLLIHLLQIVHPKQEQTYQKSKLQREIPEDLLVRVVSSNGGLDVTGGISRPAYIWIRARICTC